MIILRAIFFILCVVCGGIKFFGGNVGTLDLMTGFFLFGFLTLASYPAL